MLAIKLGAIIINLRPKTIRMGRNDCLTIERAATVKSRGGARATVAEWFNDG